VMLLAWIKPELAPPLTAEQRHVELPPVTKRISETVSKRALPGLFKAIKGRNNGDVPTAKLIGQLFVTLLPALFFAVVMFESYLVVTKPAESAAAAAAGLEVMGEGTEASSSERGLNEPPAEGGVQEPPAEGGVQEPPAAGGDKEPPAAGGVQEPPAAGAAASGAPQAPGAVAEPPGATAAAAEADRPIPTGWWISLGVGSVLLLAFYTVFTFQRLEIFKMLLASFFPLVVLILAVLGSIVFGLATPTEAAAVGAFGGYVLAGIYLLLNYPSEYVRRALLLWIPLWIPFLISIAWFRFPEFFGGPVPTWFGLVAIVGVLVWGMIAVKQAGLFDTIKESSFLTGKTSAMVCWLFVGSSIFSAAFALLGGQELVEKWVLSLGLTKTQFLMLSQFIIFVLGWPLEWTEIIVIFMPIFIPLLDNFGIDPLFFGLLVALNLQTAFLSPPVAMAAFYLKGVSPPHVTLNQIFAGMLPFMGIQVVAIVLLYVWPQIGLWLPSVLYGR
jgi:TRAP-type mannitol/chloroaromatic compound transport system permease large subunit